MQPCLFFLYIILKSIIAYFKSFSINLTINNNNKLLITAERSSNNLNANKTEPYYLNKEIKDCLSREEIYKGYVFVIV
jgi:hypothetical protein